MRSGGRNCDIVKNALTASSAARAELDLGVLALKNAVHSDGWISNKTNRRTEVGQYSRPEMEPDGRHWGKGCGKIFCPHCNFPTRCAESRPAQAVQTCRANDHLKGISTTGQAARCRSTYCRMPPFLKYSSSSSVSIRQISGTRFSVPSAVTISAIRR